MAGFLPSEQFPQPPEADWPSYRVHGGYIPVASLRIVEFDGRGGLRGNAIGVAGGRPAIQSGNDFLPAVNEVPMYSEFSGYQVDPGGKIARARMTWNHGSGTEPEYHVGIYFLTILKGADELHFLSIGATWPVVYSGVMKKTWSKE